MATINSYSISLGLAAGGFIDGAKLARGEAASLNRTLMGLATPAEQAAKKLDLLEKAVREGAIDDNVAAIAKGRLIDKINEQGAATTRTARVVTESTQQTTNSMSNMVVAFGARVFAATSIWQAFKSSIGLASEAERAKADFTVLTGSAERAMTMLAEMRAFAAATPLNFRDMQGAGQTLLAFGMSAEQVMPTLRQIGEITGGNSERFKMLSLALAQTTAAGRLMGQDLLQMVNAGFNPLQIISQKTGKSMLELKKIMEDGGISAQLVSEAFTAATTAGGMFEGRMAASAKTIGGQWDMLWGNLQKAATGFGESLAPLTGQVLTLANTLMEFGGRVGQPVIWLFKKMVDGLGLVVAMASDAVDAMRLLVDPSKLGTNEGQLGKNTEAYWKRWEERAREAQKVAANPMAAAENAKPRFNFQTPAAKVEATKAQERIDPAYQRAQAEMKRWEDAVKAQEQAHQRIIGQTLQAAQSLRDRIATPTEKLAKSLGEIRYLEQVGAINAFEAQRAASEAVKNITDTVKTERPKSMEVGSAAAYDFISQQRNDRIEQQIKVAIEQREIARATQLAQQETNRRLAELANVSPRRIR